MTKTMINEQAFFKKVAPNLFPSSMIIEEIIENSQRADATKLKITTNEDSNVVTFENNGDLLTNFDNLFIVAKSEYSEKVEKEQKPAGMGILSLLGNSHTVTFSSGYDSVKVISEKYFNDPDYRENLSKNKINCSFVDGFSIEADLKEKLHISKESKYAYYGIEIEINGKYVEKRKTQTYFNEELQPGVRLIIPSEKINKNEHMDDLASSYVIWHGKLIKSPALYPFSLIVEGSTDLITPVLPERSSIKENASELKKLKSDFEKRFENEIQKMISSISESNHLQKILAGLSCSYNIDHLTNFFGIKNDSKKTLLREETLLLKINDEEVDYSFNTSHFDYCDCISKDFEVLGSLKMGESNAPKWIIEKAKKEVLVEVEISEKSTDASSYTNHRDLFVLCESIKIDGINVHGLPLDDYIYFTKDFNYINYAEAAASYYEYEFQNRSDAEDELIEDFETIISFYNDKLSVEVKGAFFHALKSMNMTNEKTFNLDYSKLESITIEKNGDKSFKATIKIEDKEQEFKFLF